MVIAQNTQNLFGEINLSGAKNSALPIMVAACLCREPITLANIPTGLNDIKVMIELLREIGYQVDVNEELKEVRICKSPQSELKTEISSIASKIRYSLLLMPLILTFCPQVKIPSPGGCKLGDRKYDIHIDTLKKMGVHVVDDGTSIYGSRERQMAGCQLLFHIATTSGSEAAIIAGVLAEGITVIKNANTRPEVIDLVRFLNAMGADIRYKTRYIEIYGVKDLHGGKYSILSDRHEAISYAILAGICRSEVKIRNFTLEYVREDAALLRDIGLNLFEWGKDVYVSAKAKELLPFSMATGAYPGINSDMQPLLAALAITIHGESILTDTRFTERFQYVDEFRKLGADLENYENCVIIQGGKPLTGCPVVATDLRAGAALTFLGLYAQGATTISNFYQTERGYEDILNKISALGGKVWREQED